jgi:ribosome biogenesis GTPase A
MFKIYKRLKLSSNSLFSKDRYKILYINKNINLISSFATYSNENNQHLISTIQWYPGHIAKAERELVDYLKRVDVVIEVRDARIPLSTTHPKVPQWVENRPLIVVITRLDQISSQALVDWKKYYLKNPAHPAKPETKVIKYNL